jgi:ATPase subunit of ABC transporter with duplicated ATPase domains
VRAARRPTRSIVVPSIHLRGLSYAHSTAAPVLSDVDLDLATEPGGWIGVVGANGAGKSTLLHLVAGSLTPASGSVRVEPPGRPVLVPQTVDRLTDDVRAFAWTWDGTAERLRRRLDLDPDDLDPELGRGWSALSPGQRTRWKVAAALAAAPDVLLLDEPTNHLDVGARDLLVEALRGFRGVGLVVSHDRGLLDTLTDRTLRLHAGTVELHAGAYTEAAARWRVDEAARRDAHDRARREERRLRRVLGDVRRERHSAEAGPRRERRLAGATDPDAREAGRKFAQRKAEAALAQRVTQLNARVDRAAAAVDAMDVRRDHGGAVGFHHAATGRRVLAAVDGEVRHAGGAVWLEDVEVTLRRGQRVHLRGANGAGKTTLLRAVLADLSTTSEEVAVLDQELSDPHAVLAEVRALDPALRGRVLGVVALLGVDPDRVLVSDDPSPGEARKLALARALAGDASVVVLDEPTNHLDLPSIERLEDALRGYGGAIVLVTHDPALARAVTDTSWEVGDRRVTVTEGVPDEGS